jgi:hypothetical protein
MAKVEANNIIMYFFISGQISFHIAGNGLALGAGARKSELRRFGEDMHFREENAPAG